MGSKAPQEPPEGLERPQVLSPPLPPKRGEHNGCVETLGHIEVFMVGSPVEIGDDIPARIVAVMIEENRHVTYKCSWWDGRKYTTEWLQVSDIRRGDVSAITRIGFAR